MPISLSTNISAMTAQRNLGISTARSASSLAKLSSGSRVPTARDDAASLSVGTGLRLDVASLRAAQVNTMQATSMLQIADGAFGQIGDILTRMKSLATTAQSDQLSATELGFLDTEFQALSSEIDRIAGTTEFNGRQLLGGTSDVTLGATIGANVETADGFVAFEFDSSKVTGGDIIEVAYNDATGNITLTNNNTSVSQTINLGEAAATIVNVGETRDLNFNDLGVKITINDQFNAGAAVAAGADIVAGATSQFDTAAGTAVVVANLDFQVGINAGDSINATIGLGEYQRLVFGAGGGAVADITSQANAVTAAAEVDAAAEAVNTARSSLGATMNRLDFANSNISVAIENTEAARSILMDVDVSAEITNFTSQQVLIQAGVSMLAQANQQPSLLLRLLQ